MSAGCSGAIKFATFEISKVFMQKRFNPSFFPLIDVCIVLLLNIFICIWVCLQSTFHDHYSLPRQPAHCWLRRFYSFLGKCWKRSFKPEWYGNEIVTFFLWNWISPVALTTSNNNAILLPSYCVNYLYYTTTDFTINYGELHKYTNFYHRYYFYHYCYVTIIREVIPSTCPDIIYAKERNSEHDLFTDKARVLSF